MEVQPVVSGGIDCKSSIFGFGWCNSINFHSSTEENLFRKKEFNIVKIRKHEAKYLRENNYGWVVNSGHGTYRNLLMVEDTKALIFLEKYRKSIRIK